MKTSFRTRKRGTPRQIGKPFPILEKKKLPPKIKIIDKHAVILRKLKERKNELRRRLIEEELTAAERKDFQQDLDAIEDEISARESRGGKIKTGKSEPKIFRYRGFGASVIPGKEVRIVTPDGRRITVLTDKQSLTDEDLRRVIRNQISRDKIETPKIKSSKLSLEQKKDAIMEAAGKSLDPMSLQNLQNNLFKRRSEEQESFVVNKLYKRWVTEPEKLNRTVRPDLKAIAKRMAEKRLKRRISEDPQYLQYLKDVGVSKKIIKINKQMMKRHIAEKVRAVKYPVEKRGPSYQKYLQKLREKRRLAKSGGAKPRKIVPKVSAVHVDATQTTGPSDLERQFKAQEMLDRLKRLGEAK